MASRPAAPVDDEAPEFVPEAGKCYRYPVTQPDGRVRHQVILVTQPPDEDGMVRGVALPGYEDEHAQFRPEQFA